MSLPEISAMSVQEAKEYFKNIVIAGWRSEIAKKITKEISSRLNFLSDVGLDYLTINRSADTLSGGEAQRIRLASQIGSGLVGVLYVLDEPSIGLHQRDNQKLLNLQHSQGLRCWRLLMKKSRRTPRAISWKPIAPNPLPRTS